MTSPAYAVVNLEALQHNFQIVRKYAPNAKIMPVIKANAYGHGMLRIASALQSADAFAVARVDEGVRLRKAGIINNITVLEGFSSINELEAILDYRLDTVVHSFTQLNMFEARTELKACSIWIKIDTGMNRLGFKPLEFATAYQRLKSCPLIKGPINLMTHLANADDKRDTTTFKQIALFNQTVTTLLKEQRIETDQSKCSIANSAGILAWPESLTEWVRPGIMLYGISPFPEYTGAHWQLKPVMGLYSRLIAVKNLDKGDKVGYSGTWMCTKPTRLGIIAIGYGDGYPRYAKEGTPILVNGLRVPLIGRVSMDMITVDLESQPLAKPGDSVTLWGDGLAIEDIAIYADTIPYTLVCGITQRVRIIEYINNLIKH
ncbi:MAG: alanine racemase [Methylococcales bacterium]|nr:alanine racemase [Methylococcales bacterium]